MIKAWIIELNAGPRCPHRYGAYSEGDPLEKLDEDTIFNMEESLWDSYGWTATGWNNEHMEDPNDEDEYEQIYQNFKENISWSAEEDTYGEIDELEIVYDERDEIPEIEEEDD